MCFSIATVTSRTVSIACNTSSGNRPAEVSDLTLQPGEVREGVKLQAVLGCILRVTVTNPNGPDATPVASGWGRFLNL